MGVGDAASAEKLSRSVFKLASRSGPLCENRPMRRDKPNSNSTVESLDQIQTPNEWCLLLANSTPPCPRAKHAAAIAGRRMFILGGSSANGLLDDVQVLHAEKRLWLRLNWHGQGKESKQSPGEDLQPVERGPQSMGHQVVIWEKKLFVVGGQSQPSSLSVTVHRLNLESHCWSLVCPKGDVPTGRCGQSIVQVGFMLIMFGGEDVKGRILNDLHIFDLKHLVWLPLKTTGPKPAPRRDHSAACYGDRYMWVFGGKSRAGYLNDMHGLDFQTMEWTREKVKGASPKPRAGQAGAIAGSKWFIVGGESRGEEVEETIAFDLEKREWSVVNNVRSGSPLANDGLSVVKVRSSNKTFLLAFGGHGASLSNQVYALLVQPHSRVGGRPGEDCKSEGSMNSLSISLNFPPAPPLGSLPEGQDLSPPSPKTAVLRWDACRPGQEEDVAFEHDREDVYSVAQSEGHGSLVDDSREFRAGYSGHQHNQDFEQYEGEEEPRRTTSKDYFHGDSFNSNTSSRKAQEQLEGSWQDRRQQAGDMSSLDTKPSSAGMRRTQAAELHDKLLTALRINEELEGKLAEARSTNYEANKTLQAVVTEKEEMRKKLTSAMASIDELEEEVFNLMKNKKEMETKLKASLKALEETDKKLQVASQLQESAEIRLRSTLRLKEEAEKKLVVQGRMLEETESLCAAKSLDTDTTTRELEEKLEEQQQRLTAALNSQAVLEEKLATALKEKRELKEKVLGAMHKQEAARCQSQTSSEEKTKMEKELAQMKTTLKETQRELQAKELQITEFHSKIFEYQVELFDLKQKLRSASDARAVSQAIAPSTITVQ